MSVFIYIFYIHISSCLPYIKSTHPPISSKKCLFNCFACFVDYRYGENNVSINSLSVKHAKRKRGEFTYNYWMATDVLELSSLWKCVLHLWSRCTFHTYSEVNKALHAKWLLSPSVLSLRPIPTLDFKDSQTITDEIRLIYPTAMRNRLLVHWGKQAFNLNATTYFLVHSCRTQMQADLVNSKLGAL